ncbi:LysR family transcriptional regulator [Robbsia sp. Bb-Pol-6]|uniref:LysR family transcriptional regulator n=1 Tax=Robbsia betulipollinis TaxID=2981849 RepID=A0ABT3ZKR3_9BURK|nr:LysR family transcriptional regulator [Robbsia betulipollinis]MCY0386865.1 LysR family transcriptional regulator [Robbsia betulipollinis]
MDQLQSMRVFVKVADLGSFARAAAQLDMSNAVVTRHVADLEGRLDTRLMNRTTRSLSLTEAGQVYLERTRQILEELDDAEQMVLERTHEPIGTLRIVAPVVFGMHNFGQVLRDYTQRYPRVIPDITLVDRSVDLVEEGFDVGIAIARNIRSASVVSRRLTTGCLVVCAAGTYLQRHGPVEHPSSLATHACLTLNPGMSGDEHLFEGPDGQTRVRPNSVILANNTEMLRQFALQGMGVAILPSYLIGKDLERGALVPLLPDYQLAPIDIHVVYPSRRYMPAKLRTFIDHLVEHFEEGPADGASERWLADADGAVLAGSLTLEAIRKSAEADRQQA